MHIPEIWECAETFRFWRSQNEKNNLTLADKSKIEYIHQIQSKQTKLIKAATTITMTNTTKLKKGLALKKRRTVKRFSSNHTAFLRDTFIQGEITGHKCDPKELAAKMRTTRKNRCRLFSKHECLTSNRIAATYFSRMLLEKNKEHTEFIRRGRFTGRGI